MCGYCSRWLGSPISRARHTLPPAPVRVPALSRRILPSAVPTPLQKQSRCGAWHCQGHGAVPSSAHCRQCDQQGKHSGTSHTDLGHTKLSVYYGQDDGKQKLSNKPHAAPWCDLEQLGAINGTPLKRPNAGINCSEFAKSSGPCSM